MKEFNVGDNACFFVDGDRSDYCYCGEGIIDSIDDDGDFCIGKNYYHKDEIFSSWEEVAKAACNRLKQVYKDYE